MAGVDLARLNEADRVIQELVREFGLDVLPQEFDVVPDHKMLEIVAYRLPVNFSHWSFGRNFEIERTKYEHGLGIPYEVVFNSEPVRAYLMETNPFPVQVLVMAHVYAHNDFMKNNRHFQHTRRDMITSASEAAARLRKYEEDYGIDAVEKVIDAALAVQWNIDPDEPLHPETEEEARERLFGWQQQKVTEGRFDDLLPSRPQVPSEKKKELRKKTPPEPTVDLLGYILQHSPRGLEEWEQDILSIVKAQAQYFIPYRRTKIMNEGWATYWHENIMHRLFREHFLTAEEHGLYNLYNARVKSHNPRALNPYLLGSTLFRDIECRWDTGRFGPEYEACREKKARENWDRHLGEGRQKIFQVRRTHMDWFFVDEFLTREVIEELNLFLYVEREKDTYYETVVEETDWKRVKQYLVQSLMNWGVPRILLADGDWRGTRTLYLTHAYEGLPLHDEYCRKTLELIYFLWGRPVILETRQQKKDKLLTKIYRVDEDGVRVRTG